LRVVELIPQFAGFTTEDTEGTEEPGEFPVLSSQFPVKIWDLGGPLEI
jgi:hypothetical protein